MDPGRLYLNLAGREPGGIVRPDEYHAVRDELKAWAEGLPFVTRVATREAGVPGAAGRPLTRPRPGQPQRLGSEGGGA